MLFTPLTSSQAALYGWRQLAQRAGVLFSSSDKAINGFEELGIPIYYGKAEEANFTAPGLIIRRCSYASWNSLSSVASGGIQWFQIKDVLPLNAHLPIHNLIPVFLWGAGHEDGNGPFVEQSSNGSIIFNADILAASFFMLSRWEETASVLRDKYGRFSGTLSLAYRQSFLNIPIVDQFGLILREWIKLLLPSWQPSKKTFSVKLSHDVDYVMKYSSAIKTFRYIAKNAFLGSGKSQVFDSIRSYMYYKEDPYYRGVIKLGELSEKRGFKSAFYFMTADPSPLDNGYWAKPDIAIELIRGLTSRGHEIGLHPGHETFENFELLLRQKKRMEKILGKDKFGGRQHNLRFKAPATWRYWEKAGMLYDATAGYADLSGFRCGTCHNYHPFDFENNYEMQILEEPLIVMDVTLKKYNQLDPEESKSLVLELARQCKVVDGVFTLLWHNSSLEGEWKIWGESYMEILDELAGLLDDRSEQRLSRLF